MDGWVRACVFGFSPRQDAGLIFLSRMTTDVAKNVLLRGGTADEAVATALAATAFATASLGVALVVIGKLKLARFVAYLPMPVVSGTLRRGSRCGTREEVPVVQPFFARVTRACAGVYCHELQ